MFKFRPGTIPTNIFVVGCGGTGSRLIPTLVQFIRSITKEHNPTGWLGTTNIVLIDGDVVEQKNLLRQNFIQNDVDRNKAAVLANRYAKAYGMNVVAYPQFIEKNTRPEKFRQDLANATGLNIDQNTNDMVIMCVDSAEARRIVLKALAPTRPTNLTVFIDAGNEDAFGQVRMFTNTILTADREYAEGDFRKQYKMPERIEFEPEAMHTIPYDHGFYQSLQDNPGLGSCADLDQTLAINSLMAMLILSFVQNYYYAKVVDYNEVSIDIGTGSSAYTKNTLTAYRNKVLHIGGEGRYAVGSGSSHGFVGSCHAVSAESVFDRFLSSNKEAVEKIEREQSQDIPTLDAVAEAKPTKKSRSKKFAVEAEPVVIDLETVGLVAPAVIDPATIGIGPRFSDFAPAEQSAGDTTFALPA